MTTKTRTPDQHGNVIAHEGRTRCLCGSKYWENDRCVDCGEQPPIFYDAPLFGQRDEATRERWERNEGSPTKCPHGACIICGRRLGAIHASVHVVDGGSGILRVAAEDAYPEDGGDMGCFGIGAECAKTLPDGFVFQAA